MRGAKKCGALKPVPASANYCAAQTADTVGIIGLEIMTRAL